MDRGVNLRGMYIRVYSSARRVHRLKVFGAISVTCVVLAFAALCLGAYIEQGINGLVRLLLVSAVPFLLISFIRLVLNYERPYELVNLKQFERMRKLRKAGKSFPSRHVFSAFLIGAILLEYCVPLAALTLFFGAYIAVERVLLGIHFPRDVVFGAIFGVAFGLIGTLFL